jgi:hypothetical protein
VHARATANALAKQAALHAVAMLKGEVVNQFTADQLGSTTSSVSSVMAGWQRPAPSWLGVPTLPSSEMHFMVAGGAYSPVIDLNRMPVGGETSSGHNKAPRARAAKDLPDASDLFGQMPT